MEARRSAEEIRDVNARYHDLAATSYDTKWGIDFGEVGQAQVLGKLRKVIGSELDRGYGRSLEVGAGTGYFSLNLLQRGVVAEATCTDISAGMIARLSANAERLGLQVRADCADAESLPFENASFDLVLGHAVLHHLPDLERAFAEFHRVLEPGGRIVFAGEPSRLGDRLAAIPKRGAVAVAPLWRATMRAATGVVGFDAGSIPSESEAEGESTRPLPASEPPGLEHQQELEQSVDIHAFAPDDLTELAQRAGFADVRVRGEELIANWFGWFNRGLEASADPGDVPMLWRQYAFHGYLLLQRLDQRLLERRLPPAIFYNLLLSARRP